MVELKAAWKLFGEQKKNSNDAKAIEDLIKLLQVQSILEKDVGHPFLDLSLCDTIIKCFKLGHPSRALKLRNDFKVSEKRYSVLEFKALIETKNWDHFETFLKSSPKFGFQAGLDILIAGGHKDRAQPFIDVYNAGTALQREGIAYLDKL